MKFSSLLLAALPTMASGYDVACLYPDTMPDPLEARFHLHQYSGSYLMIEQIETPIVIHVAAMSSLCQINCLAYHDNDVLDAITKERPLGGAVPEEYHNSWSRMLCISQCFALISKEAGQGDFYDPFFAKWGLEGIEDRELAAGIAVRVAQEGTTQPLMDYLSGHDYHPFKVAQVIASEILLYVMQDGWNALGDFTYDTETGQAVACTANCQHYKDTTGYYPRNHPTGKPELNGTKYVVEGNDMYWQPLVDNDGYGFFSAQEHVTPHIGFTAQTKLYDSVDDMPDAPAPNYDFYAESLQVVERVKETSGDAMKKQKIAFYDNKLLVVNLIEAEARKKFKYSFEEELLFIEGTSAGEHDATIMAWRAKVKHDLVRPTTVIHRWGSDMLSTFGGDKSHDGPVDVAARDFHAFQRVMPHSEYPSGSSCICTAYAEFADAFTQDNYGGTISNIPFGAAGDGTGFGCDKAQDPSLFVSLGCNDSFVIPDMPSLIKECGQSRLWAGFHFTAAVTEGEKMCAGIGVRAHEHVKTIRNGSNLGQKYYEGDARPVCASRPTSVEVNRDATLESSASVANIGAWSLLLTASASVLALFAM